MPNRVCWQKGRAKWFGSFLLLPTHRRVVQHAVCHIPNRKKLALRSHCMYVPCHILPTYLSVNQHVSPIPKLTYAALNHSFARPLSINRPGLSHPLNNFIGRTGLGPYVLYCTYNTRPKKKKSNEWDREADLVSTRLNRVLGLCQPKLFRPL